MRRVIVSVATLAIMLIATTAGAAIDLGGGRCLDEGQNVEGVWGGELSDESCITEADYAAIFSVDNLVAEGVASDPVDNGDGTTTVNINGASVDLVSDPLDRPVAATPSVEPDAPTVREVLFGGQRHFPV